MSEQQPEMMTESASDAAVSEKEQKKQEKKMKKAVKADLTPSRNGMTFLIVLVVLVVLVLVVGLLWNVLFPGGVSADREQDASMSWFENADAEAELSADGIKAAITKAYYTVGGYLAVEFDFANGKETDQHPTSIYIELSNEDDQMIATGYSDAIDSSYKVAAGEHNSFLLYISPEYVQIKDDDLDELSYSITVDSNDA